METISGMDLEDVLRSIKKETKPFDNHSDPNAIEDCWNEVFETLEQIKTED